MKVKMMSLVAAIVLLASCSTSRTSTSANAAYDVPMTIQTGFTMQYPLASNIVWGSYDAAGVPIDWELAGWSVMDADDYAVQFDMDGQKYYAWYDSNGNWIGSTYAIRDYNLLPTDVNTTLRNKYSDYSIESVQREMWSNRMAYEIKLKAGDNKLKLLVDENGNVLKEKRK